MIQASPTTNKPGVLTTLGWAAYLACSWTWCIGMFLPVLLVRDYGVWGFVVFAVPNVIGAGAMGWVLRDGASERLCTSHRAAMNLFSAITILFQMYFLLAYADGATPGSLGARSITGPLVDFDRFPILLPFVIAAVTGLWSPKGAVLCWIVSAICFGLWLSGSRHSSIGPPTQSLRDLAFLAPTCIFGFALCPYLDITFHRARAVMPAKSSRIAFGVGFGVLFLLMLLFTFSYAALANGLEPKTVMTIFVALHVCLQLFFTITVHVVELERGRRFLGLMILLACLVVTVLLFQFLAGVSTGQRWWSLPVKPFGLEPREILYRLFMSFYGLVFPAYVWLCMIPTRDGHSGIDCPQGRRKLIVLAIAVVLAAPCYWMGFIERVEWWLAPGLGMVLLARLLVRGSTRVSAPSSPA